MLAEVRTESWEQRPLRRRRRNSPQREGEFQLLGDLGTEGEEPGEKGVRGSQVKHQQSVLNVQKYSDPITSSVVVTLVSSNLQIEIMSCNLAKRVAAPLIRTG